MKTTQQKAQEALLRIGKHTFSEQALLDRLNAHRKWLRNLELTYSYTELRHSDKRDDLIIHVPIAQYMQMFVDKEPEPKHETFRYDSEKDGISGEKAYMAYPMQFIGTVGKNQFVWAQSRTKPVWIKTGPYVKPQSEVDAENQIKKEEEVAV
jgi:hypothetical protein